MEFSLSIATKNVFLGFGNVLFNGFEFTIKKEDQTLKVPISFKHFNPFSSWERDKHDNWVDKGTKDKYDDDSHVIIRLKCAVAFVATPIAQTIGLVLNLANRITKLLLLAHLWCPSSNPYSFKARITEMSKDLFRVVATPFIFIGLLFAGVYGATISPLNGRKLYATFERCAYAGGYHRFVLRNENDLQTALIGLCFQPEPKMHLFGGIIGQKGAW